MEKTSASSAASSSSSSSIVKVSAVFTNVDPLHLIKLTGDVLVRICSLNDTLPLQSQKVTRFHSRAPPAISIHDYLARIVKYASLESACLLMLLVYIDRMCDKHPEFCISSLTVHRFIITACVVAAKSLCDSYCTNTHYSKVGGLSVQELNLLELEFLFMIEWDLPCSHESLQKYYVKLIEQSKEYTL